MSRLAGKRAVLGVTGGIAAYKSALFARLLQKAGAEVQVVMTDSATRFITAATFQGLTGQPVYLDMFDPRVPDNMGHIELSRGRDFIIVVPATADFIARLAQGRADDLLSALCLARECSLYVAPAMNRQMWQHPATQRNVRQIQDDGVVVFGPEAGDQACGETGMGRMLEPEAILAALESWRDPASAERRRLLEGLQVLLTAGPTFEPIDTVRGITNLSSGKMGYAVARAATEAGARVTLVSGRTALTTPEGVERVDVLTAREMYDAVMARAEGADIFVAVAAVADYYVANRAGHKLKRGAGAPRLELAENPDILSAVAALPRPPFCVGFAAETENLREYAQAKRRKKNIPLLAANLAQETFGRDDNALTLFDDRGEHVIPRASKQEVARALIAHIAALRASRGN
jgi:phosphopantothenoylcysteine decarboxylase/phosphopantothenate--cysteine ligase